MKTKFIIIFFSTMYVLLSLGCLKDKNNFNYSAEEIIKVTGLDESYTKISLTDSLVIEPQVSSNKDGDFEYMWGIYETNVQGYAPVLDTIGHEKNLHYLITQAAKGWVLEFRVTNKKTGYSKYFTSDINVVTQFTRGWYVVKSINNKTDIDLFLTTDTIVPDSKRENVFSEINNRQLEGDGSLINYYTDFKTDILIPGKFANTKVLFVLSNNDASVININTFKEILSFNNLFYQAPEIKSPDFVAYNSFAFYFSNNGQLSSIYNMSANSGQFGVEKLKDDKATPYHLSKYFVAGGLIDDPIFFDERSSSFISSTSTGSVLTKYSDASETDMAANDNNKTLLYMSQKSSYPLSGYAVLKDKTDTTIMIISQIVANAPGFQAVNDTVKAGAKIRSASRFTLNTEENMIYFVIGNEIWSYNLTNDFEKLQYTLPVGEEVTLLRYRKYSEGTKYSYNYFIVGTESEGNYKVRMFTKSSGNLASAPSITLEGKGKAGDVMYISPSTYDGTYVNTY